LTTNLLMAFGLMLVLEGLMPLVAPQAWRETFKRMVELRDGQLRFVGLISTVAGVLLLLMVK
jgi:Uncharacterized protein conserved in bacteria